MKKIKLPYELLIYDIENNKLRYRAFPSKRPQYLNHKQLVHGYKNQTLICISAKWYGESEIYSFTGPQAVQEFDKLVQKADVILGKNNNTFDDKHMNTQRLLGNHKSQVEWLYRSDDLETQLRRFFNLPSYSLDYISEQLGFGGKDKMEDADWNNIQDLMDTERFSFIKEKERFALEFFGKPYKLVISEGKKSFNKMIKYNKTDVLRTEQVLTKVLPFIKLKYNAGNYTDEFNKLSDIGCILCGHKQLKPTRITIAGQTHYQEFYCPNHEGYAGRATYKWDKHRHKKYGRIS